MMGLPFRIWGARGIFGGVLLCALQLISHTVYAAHTAADEAAPEEHEPDDWLYRGALGVSLAAGDGGWGTELANVVEIYGRYQIYRGLGVGASCFWLTASNNESPADWPEFHARVVEGFAEYHPFETRWIDPFARVGVLGLTRTAGNEDSNRLGLEGVAGIDFVLPHFAIGLQARHGFTNNSWTMLGLNTEARF